MKTISLSDETHRRLLEMKIREKVKTANELIDKLIIEYRKQKFLEASRIFREALDKKGITIKQFLKDNKLVSGEISDEYLN